MNPPHIFLDATAVLERQLTAYALDRWVHAMLDAGSEPADVVPDKLKNCLDNVNGSGSSGFPVNFLNWTGQHSGELLDGFGRMFSFSEELRTQLDGFVRGTEDGSTMARRVYDVFQKPTIPSERWNRRRVLRGSCSTSSRRSPPTHRSKSSSANAKMRFTILAASSQAFSTPTRSTTFPTKASCPIMRSRKPV